MKMTSRRFQFAAALSALALGLCTSVAAQTAPPAPVPNTTGPSGSGVNNALLYAVGIGAGQADLPFTTENTKDTQQVVFPTFAVVAGAGTQSPGASAMSKIGSFNFALLVHCSQAITLHRPIPVEAEAVTQDKVVAMYDKGKAAEDLFIAEQERAAARAKRKAQV